MDEADGLHGSHRSRRFRTEAGAGPRGGRDARSLVTDPPPGLFCDLIVEAAGHPSSINLAARLAAPGGHVVFIGIPVGDITLENKTFQHFLRQEVSLHGAWNSFGAPFPGKQWTVALESLASGKLRWEFMITHELALEALPGMFETFRGKNDFFSKVMFKP